MMTPMAFAYPLPTTPYYCPFPAPAMALVMAPVQAMDPAPAMALVMGLAMPMPPPPAPQYYSPPPAPEYYCPPPAPQYYSPPPAPQYYCPPPAPEYYCPPPAPQYYSPPPAPQYYYPPPAPQYYYPPPAPQYYYPPPAPQYYNPQEQMSSSHAEEQQFQAQFQEAQLPTEQLQHEEAQLPTEQLQHEEAQLPTEQLQYEGQLPTEQLQYEEAQLPTEQLQYEEAQLPTEQLQCEAQLPTEQLQYEAQLPTEQLQCEEAQLPEEQLQCEEAQLPEEQLQCEEAQLPTEQLQHEEAQLPMEQLQYEEDQKHASPEQEKPQVHEEPQRHEEAQKNEEPHQQQQPWRPRCRNVTMKMSDDVQLNKSANPWRPGLKRANAAKDSPVQETQELLRKVKSILNKLTPEKFDSLMKQITDLPIDSEERLRRVVDLIFQKAIDEPNFSVVYAKMCCGLATLKVQTTEEPGSTVRFHKVLLNRCQEGFEKESVNDEAFERKQQEVNSAASPTECQRLREELDEAKLKARRRTIGNVKFIGELFKLKMLTKPVMDQCFVELLRNNHDESLECLAKLLTTVGRDLDAEKFKAKMDRHFKEIERIVKERKTCSRIMFMLQDVLELRLNNWVPRRAAQGPKTIQQVHKEAEQEHIEEQRKVLQLLSKETRRQTDPRCQKEQDDQTAEVSNTVAHRAFDISKMPKTFRLDVVADEELQLRPLAHIQWEQGCSGWARISNLDSLLDLPVPRSVNVTEWMPEARSQLKKKACQ